MTIYIVLYVSQDTSRVLGSLHTPWAMMISLAGLLLQALEKVLTLYCSVCYSTRLSVSAQLFVYTALSGIFYVAHLGNLLTFIATYCCGPVNSPNVTQTVSCLCVLETCWPQKLISEVSPSVGANPSPGGSSIWFHSF